jgi:hypothetical protein
VKALAEEVVASGRASGLGGKTPAATVSAHIYTACKRNEWFRKVGRGEVELLQEGR